VALLGVLALAGVVVAGLAIAAPPLAAPTITSKPPNPSASTSTSFSFSGPGGATFECRLDSGSFAACTSPKSYSGLALGSHTFRVRAKKAGDTSPETTYTWSIVVPTALITSGPADPTSSPNASFTFTADASDATFECKLDSGSLAACTSPKSYSGLAATSHVFQVRAKGSAGTGAAATHPWTIDVTPPGAPTITSGPAASPAWTTSTSVSFSFTGEAGATFQCKLDSGSFGACTSPKPYSGLSQGSHTFQVKQTDAAGNAGSAVASRTFQIDSVAPPAPSITAKPANPTNATSTSFSFTDGEAGVSFLCKLDGGSFASCPSPKSYPGPLAEGSHTFQVKAKDPAGNESAAASWTWVVDTTPPNTPNITSGPFSWPPVGWQSTSAAFGFSGPSDAASYLCRMDAAAFATCTSPKSYSGLAQGQHTFEVKAVDAAGNVSTSPASRTFFVDTVAPTKPVFSQTPPDPSSTATSTFAWSSTDPSPASGIVGYLCSKENGSYQPCSSPYTYAVQTTNNGQHQFDVVAVDWAGNVSQVASYTWKVAAGSPQTFSVAGNVTGLVPGVWQSIPITITNPNAETLYVTGVTVAISGAPGGCDSGTNMELQQSSASPTNKLAVPANAVNWPVPAGPFRPQIRLKNTAVNQDNCKSKSFSLAYSGTGTNQP
jgi:large repetitive protein